MAKLFLLLLALLFGGFLILGVGVIHHRSTDSESAGSGWSEYPPEPAQGSEAVPAALPVVVHSVVDNGPVSPEYQTGYQIDILTDGTVTSIVFTPAATPTSGAAESQIVVAESHNIGVSGVEALLSDLQSLGCFELPPAGMNPSADVPIGGGTSWLEVTLFDQTYEIDGAELSGSDTATLDACQSRVVEETNIDWGG